MMNAQQAQQFLYAMAALVKAQADIAGAVAENEHRLRHSNSISYGEEHFEQIASKMKGDVDYCVREMLNA